MTAHSLFLLVDTAGPQTRVALADQTAVRAGRSWETGQTRSRDLLPAIDDIIQSSDSLRGQDLAGIVVITGPGSYTGLRVGIATANALGFAWNIPVVGIDRFMAIAALIPELVLTAPARFAVALDADHGTLFLAHFTHRRGTFFLDGTVLQNTPEELTQELSAAGTVFGMLPTPTAERVAAVFPTGHYHALEDDDAQALEGLRRAALARPLPATFTPVAPQYFRAPTISVPRRT